MWLSEGLTTNSRKLKKVAAVIPLLKAEIPIRDWGLLRNIEYIPVTKALLAVAYCDCPQTNRPPRGLFHLPD